MSPAAPSSRPLPLLQDAVRLERDSFLRTLIGHLAETLQDTIGLAEAEGYVAVVGQRVGDELNAEYRRALGVARITDDQLPAVLVDLKQRIQGTFEVEAVDGRRVVLRNTVCPFGDRVLGRPSLCMMTSNVFGTIIAENAGYGRVVLDETIARGDGRCRVVVWIGGDPTVEGDGRDYYQVLAP